MLQRSLGLMPVKSTPLWNCYPEPFPEWMGKQLSFRAILAMISAQREPESASLAKRVKG
jgi:hypothetical protein